MIAALPPGSAETFAALLLAHVLADFVFQTRAMVRNKRNPLVLLLHATAVFVLTTAATGGVWQVAVPVTLAHIVIDLVKITIPDRLRNTLAAFLIDQAAHLATLAAAAFVWPRSIASGLFAPVSAELLPPTLLTAGFIVTVLAGGHAVGLLTRRYTPERDTDSLPDAGRLIGQLERTLIFLLIFVDQPAGIGFLIAAKSILRFDSSGRQKAGEYVIIGTLASFTWALAMGYATRALLEFSTSIP